MKKFLIFISFFILLSVFHFFAPVALADGTFTVNVNANDSGKFNITVGPISAGTDIGNGGSTGPISLPAGSYIINELAGQNTNLSNYSVKLDCSNNLSFSSSGSTQISLNNGDSITCTFTNTAATTSITVKVNNIPSSDPGKFDLFINDTFVGTNSSGSVSEVSGNSYTVKEIANSTSGTLLDNYSKSFECVNGSTTIISGPGATSFQFNLSDGQNIVCTFTNSSLSPQQDTPTPTPTSTVSSPTSTPTVAPTSTSSTNNSTSSNSSTSNSTNNANSVVCNDGKPGSAPFLRSAVAGENSVTLTWDEASLPVSYYLVAYGLSSGSLAYGNPNVGGAKTTSYTISGLSGGTKYYFKVRAGNGCKPGDYSNELSATPTGILILTPAAGFKQNVLGAETETGKQLVIPTVAQVAEVKGASTSNANDENFFLKYKWYLLALFLIHVGIFIHYEKRFSDIKKSIS